MNLNAIYYVIKEWKPIFCYKQTIKGINSRTFCYRNHYHYSNSYYIDNFISFTAIHWNTEVHKNYLLEAKDE